LSLSAVLSVLGIAVDLLRPWPLAIALDYVFSDETPPPA
jgi:hypothetical protein